MAETDASNNLIDFYVYDGVGLVAKISAQNQYYFYHYDGLGSTIAITNSTGQVVNSYAYSPEGLVGAQETMPNPFQYVGRFGVMAEGNGLYYMRARYYDPEVGRFINKDPIGYAGGINLFTYVGNNSVNLLDSLGLSELNFDPRAGVLTIRTKGKLLDYRASNNAANPTGDPYAPGSLGPLPYGTFPMGKFVRTGNDPESSYGAGGFIPIILPRRFPYSKPRTGPGIHAGRANKCDPVGRCGYQHGTYGCIRTTEEAMAVLQSDPPITITIGPASKFILPVTPGLEELFRYIE